MMILFDDISIAKFVYDLVFLKYKEFYKRHTLCVTHDIIVVLVWIVKNSFKETMIRAEDSSSLDEKQQQLKSKRLKAKVRI